MVARNCHSQIDFHQDQNKPDTDYAYLRPGYLVYSMAGDKRREIVDGWEPGLHAAGIASHVAIIPDHDGNSGSPLDAPIGVIEMSNLCFLDMMEMM